MKEHKKNAPTNSAKLAGAKLEAQTGQDYASASKFTTSTPPGQGLHIADLLSHGADHGLHLSDLVRLTDLPERTVRLTIRSERLQGTPILENSRDGYFLPSSDHERARCVQRLRMRAAEIVKVADAIEKAR